MSLSEQLVELTQTPYLNLPSFATSVLAQLTTINSETPSQFDILFSHLTSAPAALSFKLALCKKIIEDASETSASSSSSGRRVAGGRALGGTARPATTSAKPRARVRTTTGEGAVSAHEGTAAVPGNVSSAAIAIGNVQNPNTVSPTYIARLPSYFEVVQLLKTSLPFFTFWHPQLERSDSAHLPNKPWATFSLLARVKFELLLAYVLVQVHRREMHASSVGRDKDDVPTSPDPFDADFAQSISDGSFAALLHELFAPQGRNEDEQMILFKDVLSGLTGLPP